MKKKISTAILAAAICLYGCYIGGNNEFAKTYAVENEPIPIPTEIPLPTAQTVYYQPGCYIKIASEPDKVIYNIGDKLDLTGLKLDVMYESGGEMYVYQENIDWNNVQENINWHKVIDSENPLENDSFIVDTSDFDSSKSGKYNITISLTQEAQRGLWYCQPINIPVTVTDDGSFIKGDVNADGSFNVADVVMLQKWLVSARDINLPDWKAADLNEDGKLDVFDLCVMKRKLIESTPS